MTLWQSWVARPQAVWFRRALFQVHLWSGIGLGFYIFFISITGSVLVYRNELYVAATPDPIVSTSPAPRLTDAQLTAAALAAHPGFQVAKILRSTNPDQAVEIWLTRQGETTSRLFDARSGADLGDAVATGFWLVSKLIELHDDLLTGSAGRRVNGLAALGVMLVATSGLMIWWPGIARWRRSLTVRRGVGWKRLTWDLHSAVGIWSVGFVLVSALSGVYLCFPDEFQAVADLLQPAEGAGFRLLDRAIYWLAYLHFGRINGIGLPCSGPGLCDQATKAVWAIFGLTPAVMFVTGAIMWWNRVLRRWW